MCGKEPGKGPSQPIPSRSCCTPSRVPGVTPQPFLLFHLSARVSYWTQDFEAALSPTTPPLAHTAPCLSDHQA